VNAIGGMLLKRREAAWIGKKNEKFRKKKKKRS